MPTHTHTHTPHSFQFSRPLTPLFHCWLAGQLTHPALPCPPQHTAAMPAATQPTALPPALTVQLPLPYPWGQISPPPPIPGITPGRSIVRRSLHMARSPTAAYTAHHHYPTPTTYPPAKPPANNYPHRIHASQGRGGRCCAVQLLQDVYLLTRAAGTWLTLLRTGLIHLRETRLTGARLTA